MRLTFAALLSALLAGPMAAFAEPPSTETRVLLLEAEIEALRRESALRAEVEKAAADARAMAQGTATAARIDALAAELDGLRSRIDAAQEANAIAARYATARDTSVMVILTIAGLVVALGAVFGPFYVRWIARGVVEKSAVNQFEKWSDGAEDKLKALHDAADDARPLVESLRADTARIRDELDVIGAEVDRNLARSADSASSAGLPSSRSAAGRAAPEAEELRPGDRATLARFAERCRKQAGGRTFSVRLARDWIARS